MADRRMEMIIAAISTYFYSLVIIVFLFSAVRVHWSDGAIGSALVLFICVAAVMYQAVRFVRSASGVKKMPVLIFHIGELLSVICGTFVTAILVREWSLSPVAVSALVGIVAGTFISGYAFSSYCGSFIGMTGAWILSYPELLGAAFIAGIIFIMARHGFHGMGGKLGVTAFFGVGVFAVFFLNAPFANPAGVVHLNISEDIVLLLICAGAAYLTQWLHYTKRIHVVASSGWVGLAGILLSTVFPLLHPGLLAAAIFSSSFAGMCSNQRLQQTRTNLLAGALCGLLFILTEPVFFLFGGKLGTIAFTAALVAKTIEEGRNPQPHQFFCTE